VERNWDRQVTADRLAEWQALLALSCATPMLLVGVGHGPEHSGQIQVCCPEGIPTGDLIGLLRKTIILLETQR
jgi:hypothetical protein